MTESMLTWTKTVPSKEGSYWLFGDPWSPQSKVIHYVEVIRVSNGLIFTCRGHGFHLNDSQWWMPAELPSPPTEGDL